MNIEKIELAIKNQEPVSYTHLDVYKRQLQGLRQEKKKILVRSRRPLPRLAGLTLKLRSGVNCSQTLQEALRNHLGIAAPQGPGF